MKAAPESANPLHKAGVAVLRPLDGEWQCLLLRAYRNWSFAKGEIEPGESPLDAAVREVAEETSVNDLDFFWSDVFIETTPRAGHQVARYYIAVSPQARVFPSGTLDEAGWRRIERYMQKALREAKVHTSWIAPHDAYESAVSSFVAALLTPGKRNLFLEYFRDTIGLLAWLGMLNSLSMMLIKYTSPGVPDCYQGNEFFDFSLVDPDNRRPVDYASRGEALIELAAMVQRKAQGQARTLFKNAPQDGRAKLYVIWRLLMLRRARASLFLHGGYMPLTAAGTHAANVVAYARRYAGSGVITIAGRMFGALGVAAGALPCGEATWGDTQIALPFLGEGTVLRHALSGETVKVAAGAIRVADAYAAFPGAVFEYDRGEIGAASR